MAYNQRYNPDSLPAFAEPERRNHQQQAAPPAANPAIPPPSTRPAQPNMYAQPYGQQQPPPPQAGYQQQQHQQPSHLAPQGGGYDYGGGGPQGYGRPPAPAPAPAAQQYGARPPQSSSPGYAGGGFGRQPSVSRPPPSPAPPEKVDPSLFPLFKAVDKDGSGKLSERELRAALVNGDWSSFDPHTVRMMVRMFDTDRDGTIGFEEFCGLWGFLAAWRGLFDRFDTDRSGNISETEYTSALVAFGYRLSPQFTRMLFDTFDKRGEGAISFDLFVQSCISLKRMTDVFKKYDDDRDGFITLSFEDFLTETISQNM